MTDTQKKKRRLAALTLLALMSCFVAALVMTPHFVPVTESTKMMRDRIREERFVIHAGGYLPKAESGYYAFTNSLDAVENMYEMGNRICEIDIRETSDGVLVCAHGDDQYLADGMTVQVGATSEAFLSQKVYGEFRPMTFDDLVRFMKRHEDLYIITDVKENNVEVCRRIAESYPEMRNRFIIQIYHACEYDSVASYGFPYIVYTLYRATEAETNIWKLSDFAEQHEIVAFTFPDVYFLNRKYRTAMARTGTPFMFHTINHYEMAQEYLKASFVIGVYTDRTDFRMMD